MSDELRFDATLAVERLLEREDHQHAAAVLPHKLDSSLLPRPELRAHVVNDRHAALVQLAGKAEVEVREVDEHTHVGGAPLSLVQHLVEAAIDGGNVLDDFNDADFGDLTSVRQQLAAGRAHLVSADAEELDVSVQRSF